MITTYRIFLENGFVFSYSSPLILKTGDVVLVSLQSKELAGIVIKEEYGAKEFETKNVKKVYFNDKDFLDQKPTKRLLAQYLKLCRQAGTKTGLTPKSKGINFINFQKFESTDIKHKKILIISPEYRIRAIKTFLQKIMQNNQVMISGVSGSVLPLNMFDEIFVLEYTSEAFFNSNFYNCDFLSLLRRRIDNFRPRITFVDNAPYFEDIKIYLKKHKFTQLIENFPKDPHPEIKIYSSAKSFINPIVQYKMQEFIKKNAGIVFIWEKKGLFKKARIHNLSNTSSTDKSRRNSVHVYSPGVKKISRILSKKLSTHFDHLSSQDNSSKMHSRKLPQNLVSTSKLFYRSIPKKNKGVCILGSAEIFYQLKNESPTEIFFRQLVKFINFSDNFLLTMIQAFDVNNKLLFLAKNIDYPSFWIYLRKQEKELERLK